MPTSDPKTSPIVPSPTEMLRSLRSRTSSSGSATRSSRTTNAAPNATAARNAPMTHTSSTPRVGASMMAYTSDVSAPTDSSAPMRSSAKAAGFLLPGTSRVLAMAAIMATGTATRKTDPHQNWESSHPPSTGPTGTPRTATADQRAIASTRSSRGKMSTMMASVAGMIRVASQEVVSEAGRRSPQGDLLRTTLPMQVDVRDHRIILHEGLTNVEEDDGGHRERGRIGAAPQAGIGS